MTISSTAALGAGAAIFVALVFVVIGPPRHVPLPAPAAVSDQRAVPTVAAHGIALSSESIDLPDDNAQFPAGPHSDVINANCTSCHSAAMALYQPPLSADQWKATVEKMRDTYKAPVPDSAVPDIVTYLVAMNGAPSGVSTAFSPPVDRSGGTG